MLGLKWLGFSPPTKRLAAQAHVHLTWPAQHFVRLKHESHGARSISCSPLQGCRSIHADPDNSVRLTSKYGSRSIHAGPDNSVRLTSEYGSRSIHAGPDNSVRLTSEYGSRSIHAITTIANFDYLTGAQHAKSPPVAC